MNDIRADFIDIASKLRARGTTLNPPADEACMARLESVLGGELSQQARALFSTFDGFASRMLDNDTMVYVWTSDEILRQARAKSSPDGGHIFADHFFSADFFRCDLRSDGSGVWWDERGYVAARSLLEFCRELGAGCLKSA